MANAAVLPPCPLFSPLAFSFFADPLQGAPTYLRAFFCPHPVAFVTPGTWLWGHDLHTFPAVGRVSFSYCVFYVFPFAASKPTNRKSLSIAGASSAGPGPAVFCVLESPRHLFLFQLVSLDFFEQVHLSFSPDLGPPESIVKFLSPRCSMTVFLSLFYLPVFFFLYLLYPIWLPSRIRWRLVPPRRVPAEEVDFSNPRPFSNSYRLKNCDPAHQTFRRGISPTESRPHETAQLLPTPALVFSLTRLPLHAARNQPRNKPPSGETPLPSGPPF